MPEGNYNRAQGRGGFQEVFTAVSLSDGDTFDTGLDSVEAAQIETRGNTAGTNGALQLATVTSISGGTLTADVATIDATDGGSAQNTGETMDVKASGSV